MFQALTMTSLVGQAKSRLHGDMAMALLRTFAARGVASFGSFALVAVLGHLYGLEGVGVYAIAQSLIIAINVPACWGMNNGLLRFVSRDLRSRKLGAYLRYACVRAGIFSLIGAVLVFMLRANLASLFHSPNLDMVLVGFAAAIPPFVLSYIMSGFLAAVRKPATACLLQNGAISLVAAILVIVLAIVLPTFGIAGLSVAFAVAAWLVFIWGLWSTLFWLHKRGGVSARIDSIDIRTFRKSSSAFLAADVASFAISVVGIWVAGYWLNAAAVGLFKAASQLSMLIGFALAVINLIVPPRFSALFHQGNWRGLTKLARQSACLGLVLAGIPVLACLLMPALILRLVGPGFEGAALLLQILALGQLFNLGCGSVGHLLNMTGHERISSAVAWLANVVGLTLITIGTPLLGVVPVAVGVASAMVLRKLGGAYYVWRKLGIWIVPLPNIMRILGIRPGSVVMTTSGAVE